MGFFLDRAVLAVDGGGTRCHLAVESAGERIVAEAGPANVSTDADGAAQAILEGLERLAALVGATPERLAALPAYLGLAGVIGPRDAEAIRARLPFRGALIEDDRRAALEGALGPDGAGALVHCGTGSFLGHRSDGGTRLAGGRGHRLGDEASATWIAGRALAATLDAADGLIPASDLTRHLAHRLGGARGIVGFSRTARHEDWGGLAPTITAAAEARDPTARRIMKTGAAHIAERLRALGWRPGEALCLTGGVGPDYLRYLPAPMRASIAEPAGAPIDGALALARTHAGVGPS